MSDPTETAPPGAWIGTLDPRVRIAGAALFALVVVSLKGFVPLGLALGLACALLALARLPPGPLLRRLWAMDGFIVLMLIMLPFTTPGTPDSPPLATVLGFPASAAGLETAIRIGLQAKAVSLVLLMLVGTLDAVTLGHALYRLGVPAALVHLLLFTVRYIDVIRREYERLRIAMKARGFRPATNRHTYRTFGFLIGMMLVRALERSERILQAMKCRGFSGTLPLLDDLRARPRDWGFALGLGAALVALVLLDLWGWQEVGRGTIV